MKEKIDKNARAAIVSLINELMQRAVISPETMESIVVNMRKDELQGKPKIPEYYNNLKEH